MLTVWDHGTPAPPIENLPPSLGSDPHNEPFSEPSFFALAADFLATGTMSADPCPGSVYPCP